MKKIISFLIIIASFFGLVSCNKSETFEKIEIDRDINMTSAIDLYATSKDKPNLKALIDKKETFLLYVYVPTCTNCKLFSKIYDEFILEHNAVLYKTTSADLNVLCEDAPLKAPYLTFFRNGEMKEKFMFSDYHDVFTKKESFEEFFNDHCILKEMEIMREIDKSILDLYIKQNKEFVVYFGWNQCSDCSYMDEHYLQDFLSKNDKQFYYFETNPYHPTRDDDLEGQQKWKEFKAHYGFGSYREGRVPSICYYKDGECKDLAVYLNDELDFNEENNTVTIKSSYYEDNPLIGKEFKGSSLGEAYSAYKDGSKEFYNKKMDDFFNKYLK